VSTNVAVDVPELVAELANVVDPHPLIVGAARLVSVKLGSTIAILSAGESTLLMEKLNVIDEAVEVTGVAIFSSLCFTSDVRAATAVDEGMAVGAMLVALAKVTAIVRVARFAA
jgi:hypothetical protein